MSLLRDYLRVSRRFPCRMCGKPDWCLNGAPGGDREDCCICQRIESEFRVGEAGALHRVGTGQPSAQIARIGEAWRPPPHSPPDFEALQRRLAAGSGPELLHPLAQGLGVPGTALKRLGTAGVTGPTLRLVNVYRGPVAWTTPMRRPDGFIIGVRVRVPDGSKFCVRGSKLGLFIPAALSVEGERLFVAEGESDTAALLAVGIDAIGRPGCRSVVRHTLSFVRTARPCEVVVVLDNDGPGRDGGRALAGELSRRTPFRISTLTPPVDFKDVRDWIIAGASGAQVRGRIRAGRAS